MASNDLGIFLRNCREAITPADVGLPTGTRRRTPGLRRAELATLAGISVEYLTRLEQGRDHRPSPEVLGALAEALRLSNDERFHLMLLSKAADGTSTSICGPGFVAPERTVRPAVRAILESLEPAAAVLLNSLTDVLAYTEGYARVMGHTGLLDAEVPNLVRFLFTDSRAHASYPDWDHVASGHLDGLRLNAGCEDQHATAFLNELTTVSDPDFTRILASSPCPNRRNGVERLTHPEVGDLRLAYETMELQSDGQRILVYLPHDEVTVAALDRLTGRKPGALRAVR